MPIQITVLALSRRDSIETPVISELRPWRLNGKQKWNRETILTKAADSVRVALNMKGRPYLETHDEPQFIDTDNGRVYVAIGTVRMTPAAGYHMYRRLTGVVEVRITGLYHDNFES